MTTERWKNDKSQNLSSKLTVFMDRIIYPEGVYQGWVNANGEKHGKGIMKYSMNTRHSNPGGRYDGNWKNDKRDGFGVFYYFNGKRYEGGHRNDRICGKGKVFKRNGGLQYEGEFYDGKISGRGIFYKPPSVRFEGNFIDGNWYGHGVLTSGDSRIEGHFTDEYCWKGTIFSRNFTLECEGYDFSRAVGQVSIFWKTGNWYRGGMSELGVPDGFGSFYSKKRGLLIKGNFEKGAQEKKAFVFDESGRIFEMLSFGDETLTLEELDPVSEKWRIFNEMENQRVKEIISVDSRIDLKIDKQMVRIKIKDWKKEELCFKILRILLL